MPHRDNAANSDAVAAVAWWPCVVIMLETSNSLDIDSASVSLLFFPSGRIVQAEAHLVLHRKSQRNRTVNIIDSDGDWRRYTLTFQNLTSLLLHNGRCALCLVA